MPEMSPSSMQDKIGFKVSSNYLYTEQNNKIKDDLIHSPGLKKKKTKLNLVVFETSERVETEAEVETRKREAALLANAKDNKKKPPKKEELEEGPVTIKEAKLSNIDMDGYQANFSKWVGSQLQVIKDRNIRDVYTNKPIWTKIYPQQQGVPIYNKSGKFRLYLIINR